jgi:hypothetical protein
VSIITITKSTGLHHQKYYPHRQHDNDLVNLGIPNANAKGPISLFFQLETNKMTVEGSVDADWRTVRA